VWWGLELPGGHDDDRIRRPAVVAEDEIDADPALLAATHLAVGKVRRRLLYDRGRDPFGVHLDIEFLRQCRRRDQGYTATHQHSD